MLETQPPLVVRPVFQVVDERPDDRGRRVIDVAEALVVAIGPGDAVISSRRALSVLPVPKKYSADRLEENSSAETLRTSRPVSVGTSIPLSESVVSLSSPFPIRYPLMSVGVVGAMVQRFRENPPAKFSGNPELYG